jgi:hypothetical protein
MGKFLIGLLVGAVVGGALIFFLFTGGAPRAAKAPGEKIKPPDPNGGPGGTATVVLKQDFFNEVLGTIFRDMNAPAFPLNLTGQIKKSDTPVMSYAVFQSGGNCDGRIILKPEGSGVNTGVKFENGQILAPLAFSGSTSVFGSCVQFSGWANANLDLRYDESQQAVFGQINVQTVNLDGVSPIVSGFVTPIVQGTLNTRVNPIPILRGEQLALSLPIQATSGTLNAKVKDVRSEVKDNALNLYVVYDFKGTKQ